MDFQNSPPFEKSACFYVTISGNFESYQYLNFETDFLENENFFQKTGAPFFSWKLKLSYQKPMLRQIEWREQKGYIAKNGVLPVTTSFFFKKFSVQEPSVKSWFDVPTTQISLSILKEILQLPFISTHLQYIQQALL